MELVDKEIKQLRSQAKVEYIGDFAPAKVAAKNDSPKNDSPKNDSQGPGNSVPDAAGKKAASNEATAKQDTTYMNKGLSGLK
jgi:hypothetical protein